METPIHIERLVLFPLQKEMQFFLLGMNSELRPIKVGDMNITFSQEYKTAFAVAGHGKTQFGIQSQFLISRIPTLKIVYCIGAAGGICPSVKPLDIVIGSQTVEHDYTELFDKASPLPEFQATADFDLSPILEQPSVHHGRIASGDEDVVSRIRANTIRQKTSALCVAWEGAGCARAANFNKLPFLEIRAISDNACEQAAQDFTVNLEATMKRTASILKNAWSQESQPN